MLDEKLSAYLDWVISSGDPFAESIVEQLDRYPVSVTEFVT